MAGYEIDISFEHTAASPCWPNSVSLSVPVLGTPPSITMALTTIRCKASNHATDPLDRDELVEMKSPLRRGQWCRLLRFIQTLVGAPILINDGESYG